MKILVSTIAFLFLLGSAAFAQTNPCTVAATTTVYSPSKVYFQIDNFGATLPGGTTPEWTELALGIFNNGVNPATGAPVTTATFTKAQLTLVSGTTNCYLGTPTVLVSQPVGTMQFAAARIRRTAPDVAESPWSANSNPFARPAALLAPTAVRVTQ